MALTLRRWVGRSDRQTYEPADFRPVAQAGQPSDDYIVETGAETRLPPASLQVVRFLQFILIAAIALLSVAVFWMIGLILGVF